MHNEFLQVDERKMSKSLSNFYTLFDLESRGYKDLMPLRYLFLNTHYRKKMNFTWEALAGAEIAYGNIIRGIDVVDNLRDQKKEKYYLTEFADKLANDLNMPQAIAVLHEVLNDSSLPSFSKKEIITNFDQVLGLNLLEKAEEISKSRQKKLPLKIASLVKKREVLREEGKWAEADKLRGEIEKLGYIIEDAPKGADIRIKNK